MGYTTKFRGRIEIQPPLNEHEIRYLKNFAGTRRMNRNLGPYFIDIIGDDNHHGQRHREDIIDYNSPFPGDEFNLAQPGLWCGWVPTSDGTALEWNGVEKFYSPKEWMRYLIETFLKPECVIDQGMHENPDVFAPGWIRPPEFVNFLDHTLNGVVDAQGEEYSDRWDLIVTDNEVTTVEHQTDPAGYDEDASYGYDMKAWAVTLGPKSI